MDLSVFLDPAALLALAGLVLLELVLAVDNLIFITILTSRLPEHQQPLGRKLGLLGAVVTRIMLLLSAAWLITLTAPLFTVFEIEISGRDLVLILGGLFLIWKATMEIHERVTPKETDEMEGSTSASGEPLKKKYPAFWAVIGQIAILDIVFSLDSVITAIGLSRQIEIMVVAVLLSVAIMVALAEPLARFVNKNPNVVMLALSFLVMIGMALVAEGFDVEIPKMMIYGAMGFSVLVEVLNMASRRAKLSQTFRGIRDPEGRSTETK
ncbi:TerC family protein [Ferrovibrio terrae]|uniref:TerC family protein n=1 Tax=Ferrovibrio terrae TaxID=2594003 RepID=A0A516H311_9PROT|nr:TerC family protein [Ferrovibrio terrae]QDO98166.1 TerC family protein [Ferrovibrio terrae]